MPLSFLLVIAASFAVSIVSVRLLIAHGDRWRMVDVVNDRSMHTKTTVRAGGLGILAAVLLGWGLSALTNESGGHPPIVAILCLLVLVPVSAMDDVRHLRASLRLSVHLLCALVLGLSSYGLASLSVPGIVLDLGFVSGLILSIIFVVWSMNLYNFMDGMDGLAGGMAAFGFLFLSALGLLNGDPGYALSAMVVSVSCLGFLVYNFPPARIFMGDAGSVSIGFLVAFFILWANESGIAELWTGVMIFSPFFVDATVTVLRRAVKKQRLWEAHREHYYQKAFHLMGVEKRRILFVEYALMVAVGSTACVIQEAAPLLQWAVIAFWCLLFVGLAVRIDKKGRCAS